MKVLITGGGGFIGSHIADLFASKSNHGVVVVDRDPKWCNRKVKLIKLDLRNHLATQSLILQERPDTVIHCAAQVSVSNSVTDALNDAEENILAFINVLQACEFADVGKVIFSSTGGALYGECPHPMSEDSAAYPESPYGISKLSGEHYLRYFSEKACFDGIAFRYSNVYGPRQDPHGEAGVVAIFINRLLDGMTATINGDGGCIRDYVYVGDVAEANLLVAETNIKGCAINIASGTVHNVNEIAQIISSTIRKKQGLRVSQDFVNGPPRIGDIQRSELDITKAGEILGWVPRIELEEGIERTVNSFRNKGTTIPNVANQPS